MLVLVYKNLCLLDLNQCTFLVHYNKKPFDELNHRKNIFLTKKPDYGNTITMNYRFFILILSGLFLFSGCKAEDEDAEKYSPLLSLLDINVIQGVHYNGNSFITECKDSPLLQKCLLIKESEYEIYKHITQNTMLTVWIENNAIKGNLKLVTAHFDLSAEDFEFSITGNSKDEPSGKKILTADPVSGIESRTHPDYIISLRRLQLEMDHSTMVGAMDLHLQKKNEEGFADIVYTVHLNKEI